MTLQKTIRPLSLLVAVWLCFTTAFAQNAPQREITQIAGDLYRFQNNFHYSVFLVTPEGIIATDPIDADAAKWLMDELTLRFNQDVKYVIYSHDHADHISGGEVFKEAGATIIAHENAKRAIIAENRPTAVPDITFSDHMTLELGGKSVELSYVGRNHSDNSIVMNFPAERTLFAVDFIPVKSLPFQNLPTWFIPDWMDSLAVVEAMDFDILAPGHGPLGDKSDVTAMRGYANDLYNAVLEQIRAGKTLEEAQEAITLDAYKDWGQYEDYLPLNIEGMYNRLVLQRPGN
jgi:glyoxylase-like metal-dependent hydrolase (beta-lactamase superfamily II)